MLENVILTNIIRRAGPTKAHIRSLSTLNQQLEKHEMDMHQNVDLFLAVGQYVFIKLIIVLFVNRGNPEFAICKFVSLFQGGTASAFPL